VRETCYHCKYADFKTQLDTPMRGFAKCAKARNAEEKATYYPRINYCATGAFRTASKAVIARRSAVLGENPLQYAKFEQEGG
jgi:probable phage associated protein